jgi:hypothetical protein
MEANEGTTETQTESRGMRPYFCPVCDGVLKGTDDGHEGDCPVIQPPATGINGSELYWLRKVAECAELLLDAVGDIPVDCKAMQDIRADLRRALERANS